MKRLAWLVSMAALGALLLAGCGGALAVTHHSHPLIFPTLTPGAARAAPGTTLYTYRRTAEGVNSIAWSPDSQQIASADSYDNKILIWDAATGQTTLTLQAAAAGNIKLAWSPDGKQLAASIGFFSSPPSPSIVQIWDVTTGASVANLEGPPGQINDLAYSPDSSRIAYAADDATVTIWNVSTSKKLYTYQAPGPVKGLAWSADGALIASISQNFFQIWNSFDGTLLLVLGSRTPQLTAVAWSPDGQTLATGAADGSAQTWDMFALTGKTIATYTSPQGSISALSWSPDSQYLVTASGGISGGAIQVWQAATGSVILTYQGQDSGYSVAWSPDGTRIASSDTKTVQVWAAP